jgi:hypothetical protein
MPRRPTAMANTVRRPPPPRRSPAGLRLGPAFLALVALTALAAPATAQNDDDPSVADRTLPISGNLRGDPGAAQPDRPRPRSAPARPDTSVLDEGETPTLERIGPNGEAAEATPATAASSAAGAAKRPTAATRRDLAVRPVEPAQKVLGGPVPPRPATEPDPRDLKAAEREEREEADTGYEALGLRTGSFTFLPAVEASIGRNSNVATKSGGPSATVWQLAPELVGRSDWSRHALSFELRGSQTVDPGDRDYDRPMFRSTIRGRVDAGDETRIDLGAGWARERQTASKSDDPNSTRVGADLTTRTATLGVTRDVGLVAVTLRGDVERSDYVGGTTVSGAPLGAEAEDNTRWTGALRGTWGPTAPLRPFVEVRVSRRDYDDTLVGGSPRDGHGRAAVTGLVADFGPKLRGEIATGWGTEKPDRGPLGAIDGWLLDGSLVWSPNRLTTVRLDAKTGFDPTTVTGATGSVARTTAITIERAVRRDLVASLGASLTTRGFVGISRDETDLLLSSGLTWKLNRNLQTFVRGSLERFTSTEANSDWNAAVVMVGVRIQQ